MPAHIPPPPSGRYASYAGRDCYRSPLWIWPAPEGEKPEFVNPAGACAIGYSKFLTNGAKQTLMQYPSLFRHDEVSSQLSHWRSVANKEDENAVLEAIWKKLGHPIKQDVSLGNGSMPPPPPPPSYGGNSLISPDHYPLPLSERKMLAELMHRMLPGLLSARLLPDFVMAIAKAYTQGLHLDKEDQHSPYYKLVLSDRFHVIFDASTYAMFLRAYLCEAMFHVATGHPGSRAGETLIGSWDNSCYNLGVWYRLHQEWWKTVSIQRSDFSEAIVSPLAHSDDEQRRQHPAHYLAHGTNGKLIDPTQHGHFKQNLAEARQCERLMASFAACLKSDLFTEPPLSIHVPLLRRSGQGIVRPIAPARCDESMLQNCVKLVDTACEEFGAYGHMLGPLHHLLQALPETRLHVPLSRYDRPLMHALIEAYLKETAYLASHHGNKPGFGPHADYEPVRASLESLKKILLDYHQERLGSDEEDAQRSHQTPGHAFR